MPQKIWNLMYVAGNPALFSRMIAAAGNPMSRSAALAAGETVQANGWRAWVEHCRSGARIFESHAERQFQSGGGGWVRLPGDLEGCAPVRYGDEVLLWRGNPDRSDGPGRHRAVRARLDKVVGLGVHCTLLEDDPQAVVGPRMAGESGMWQGLCSLKRPTPFAPLGAA